jgi:hypothetical protein
VPTRVLLEGPAIEPLLAQVREEYGSSVRIISADKVRSGGFGGFFAKQRYELSVEVPDEVVESPLEAAKKRSVRYAAADDSPPTLEQLLARAESNDRIASSSGDLGIEAVRRTSRPVDADAFGASRRDADPDDTEAAPGDPASGPGSYSTDNAFADLLAGLDSANATAAAAAAAGDDDQDDKPAVRPFRPSPAQGSSINGVTIKALPPVPSLAELMGGLGLEDLIPPVDAPEKANGTPTAPTNGTANGASNGAPGVLPNPKLTRLQRNAAEAYGQAPSSGPPAIASARSAPNQSAPAQSAPAQSSPSAPAQTSPGRSVNGNRTAAEEPSALATQQASDPVVANLVRVGMPESLAAMIKGADTYAGVLTALASRPAAPSVPDAPGEILVLAGELSHALPIARQIVEQVGLEQTHLLLAGPSAAGTGIHSSRVISGPSEAEKRSEKLQSAEAAWVVVLDAPVGSTDPTWVRDTCEALGATAVWAVVDATRKTADTARHLATLGEVEALVVHGVDVTSDPASVLGLDLPIVSLDGKPATPHAWAAMLCARIAADVAPVAAPTRRPSKRGR